MGVRDRLGGPPMIRYLRWLVEGYIELAGAVVDAVLGADDMPPEGSWPSTTPSGTDDPRPLYDDPIDRSRVMHA